MRPARVLPALLLAAVAACTGASHRAAPSSVTASTTTTTTTDYGVQYLAITAPATDALTRFEGTASPTPADCQSAESASETLPYQLLQASWPAKAGPDIRALASDWSAVVADLRLLVFNPAGDTSFGFDESKLSAAVRIVKSDLRLST
jgi:hypothetical protein